jgi:hypothetical protein
VDDLPYPGGRTVAVLGDLGVGQPAPRQQNDAGVAVIDLIGELAFHLMKLEPFMGLERPYFDGFDSSFSISFLNISMEKLRRLGPQWGHLFSSFSTTLTGHETHRLETALSR